ncbi:MAG TPA: hypothetical protein VKK79_04040 [Candidatus Lokiarchaeia archaeon]|nr:hypothetical protein [Candidatus Lokiarchaeia archaeon]
MRIRKRGSLKAKNAIIVLVGLLPLILIGVYFGMISAAAADLTSFSYTNPVNPEKDFVPLANMDAGALANVADLLEWRMDVWHTPINLTVNTRFNATDGTWVGYDGTDNGALWTGTALTAECLRYSVLDNGTQAKANSSELIHKLLSGLANLLIVPNGGLGPDYPGMLARFYASPADYANFTWMFAKQYKQFNGTGDYSQWRVRLYTSKDEIGGYLMALAAVQHYVQDDPWVQETLRLMIAQLVNGFVDTFWQEMHGDGTPDGAQLNPLFLSGSEWKLLAMKLAVNAYPDNTVYRQLYEFYAAKDLGVITANSNNDYNTLDQYFGYNFGHDVFFGLVLAEDNVALRNKYIDTYEKSYYIWANHRNAWFNSIYLAMCKMRGGPAAYNLTQIKWDVCDQLWRIYTTGWYPMDTTYGNRSRSTSRADLGGDWLTIDPNIAKWQNFFASNTFGSWFAWIPQVGFQGILDNRYVKAARSDMYDVESFMWSSSPFTEFGGHTGTYYGSNSVIDEASGTAFTAPYWMLRAFGYINDTQVA